KRHAFRGYHVFFSRGRRAATKTQWANTKTVAESEYSIARYHGYRSISTLQAFVDATNSRKKITRFRDKLTDLLQFMGKNVEQYLTIRRGIDMTKIRSKNVFHQRRGVNQVTVLRQRDTVRRVNIKGLRFGWACGAGIWVAHMANSHFAN